MSHPKLPPQEMLISLQQGLTIVYPFQNNKSKAAEEIDFAPKRKVKGLSGK